MNCFTCVGKFAGVRELRCANRANRLINRSTLRQQDIDLAQLRDDLFGSGLQRPLQRLNSLRHTMAAELRVRSNLSF
jgi:hypothetical protein